MRPHLEQMCLQRTSASGAWQQKERFTSLLVR